MAKLYEKITAVFAQIGEDIRDLLSRVTALEDSGMVVTTVGTTYDIDLANGTLFYLTLSDDCSYGFPSPTAGKRFKIYQVQDSVGSRVPTFPSNVRWSGGVPTSTTTANRTDVYSFEAQGTYWVGYVLGQDYDLS